jgi:hypothetical protein
MGDTSLFWALPSIAMLDARGGVVNNDDASYFNGQPQWAAFFDASRA